MGAPTQHPRRGRVRVGVARGRARSRGARIRAPRPRAGHAQRLVPVPPRDDRARARSPSGRRERSPRGAPNQPELLDPRFIRGPERSRAGEGKYVRARTLRVLAVTAGAVLSQLIAAPAATAHPLGNFTVNRSSAIAVRPDAVEIAYMIDMAEIPTYQEMPAIDTDGDGTASSDELTAW